jgi:hypothetical protein
LLGKDIETSQLESLMGYDPNLDDAIKLVLQEESEWEEEEDDGYFEEDDE